MTYENFIVPNTYWEYVLGQRRASFINDYYKKNKNYPPEDILKDVALTIEEKEQYKRIFYAQYKATGIVPSEPNTPQEPDVPSIPPVSGGDETETPIIPPSSGNMVNVMFDITMDDIPETVGVGNNVVNTIFKQGILNGDLLDKSVANIVVKNDNATISIKDLTKIYTIPIGEYVVSGTVGQKTTDVSIDKTFLALNTTIEINDSEIVKLKPLFTESIIVSNVNFILQWNYSNGYNSYHENYDSYTYKGYNYTFSHTPYRINSRVFIFNDIRYEVTNENWVNGSAYYYNINTNDYDEWLTMVYNVTTTKEPTKLFGSGSVTSIGTMKIDDELTDAVSAHTFNTLGKHEVKVLLKDTTKNGTLKFENISQLKELTLPSSINSLSSSFLYDCGGIEKITCYAKQAPSIAYTYINNDGGATFKSINKNGVLLVPQDSNYEDSLWIKTKIYSSSDSSIYNLGYYGWSVEYMK